MQLFSILIRWQSARAGSVALASLLIVSLALPPAAIPQAAPGKQEPGRIRVGVDLVNLFATVRDGKKKLVPDLTKDDFRVFEDNQEQKVEYFTHETTLPITLGILIDTSISVEGILGAEKEAAARFLERVMRKGDLAFVISFDVDVDLLSDFTEDHGRLERAIDSARINAPGAAVNPGPFPTQRRGTRFYDAIYLAAGEKLAREYGRKALVILTDADDAGSQMRLEQALEAAQRTDTVVHIILLYDPNFYGFGGNPGGGVARKIAEETGGRVIEVRDEKKLQEAFDQISEELRSQYTLGYYPANKERDGKFRKIKIETTQKGLKVLARKGYYAPKN
jgi:VWFA-related protein